MKKIVLKSLAITLSAISLLNVSSINALDDKKLDEPQITQQIQEQDTTEEKSDLVLKYLCTTLGVEIGVGIAILTGQFAWNEVDLTKKEQDFIDKLRKLYLKNFISIGENILTKRQERSAWDWLACLQGLLKDRGIEKSQKELFKGITGKSPGWFYQTTHNRLNEQYDSSKFMNRIHMLYSRNVDFVEVEKYINKEFKLKLWKEIIKSHLQFVRVCMLVISNTQVINICLML